MERPRSTQAMIAGLCGTLLMTFLMATAPVIGLPRLDMAAITGTFITDSKNVAPHSDAWWVGLVAYYVIGGVILSLGYIGIYPLLRGPEWLRGLTWGLACWLVLELAVMPIIGQGIFSTHTSNPTLSVLSALIAHVAYGLVLGEMSCRLSP